ncbi:MAG: hypothetical protein LBV77_02875 [Candidatus Adiutrix intracellularis]|nr:hypothetical protein [Candidatus Adiutrix intracellularis]
MKIKIPQTLTTFKIFAVSTNYDHRTGTRTKAQF